MRLIAAAMVLTSSVVGCATADTPPAATDCRACMNPDSPGCASCLGTPGDPDQRGTSLLSEATPVQLAITEDNLAFAVIGDTRPAVVNDTAGYPTAVITKIFQDLEALNPRPGFAVATGDYQFSSNGSTETAPQLDKYLAARASFSNPVYPAMGNHECTGATRSNCGPGTANGSTSIYNTYLSKLLAPLGITTPYYSLLITPTDKAWSAKVVFIAANAWTKAQATWLANVLSQPSTYTFIVRHEHSFANTAPGVLPSESIIAAHPYTMLIVGHQHAYRRVSQKEVLFGNGGAPLTTGSAFGYGVVSRRSDGAIQFTIFDDTTRTAIHSFAVNADGSTAAGNPPPLPPPPPPPPHAQADRPPPLVLPQVAMPIRCDGELDELAWRTPARTGPFTDATGAQAAPHSEARFLRDDHDLYIALYAADEDIRASDEFVVELGSGRRRSTLHVTAGGALNPAIAGARVAVDVDGTVDEPSDDDEEWVVEAAIPLTAVPFGRTGTVNLQISRCDVTKDHIRRCGVWKGTITRRRAGSLHSHRVNAPRSRRLRFSR